MALLAAYALFHVNTTDYRMPSESMAPTIDVGEHLTGNTEAYDGSRPEIGDIVVIHPPEGAESARCGVSHPRQQVCPRAVAAVSDVKFLKRVVAGPGDRLKIIEGKVVLNGKPQPEPFVAPCDPGGGCNFPREVTVPDGQYFMLGDNRGSSDDSRFWGPVPSSSIVARIDKCLPLNLSCDADRRDEK